MLGRSWLKDGLGHIKHGTIQLTRDAKNCAQVITLTPRFTEKQFMPRLQTWG